MTEQNETQEVQSSTDESKVNEVVIVKRRTLINCEEFVSIQLKSSSGTIGGLLKKAISATQLPTQKNNDMKLGGPMTFSFNLHQKIILLSQKINLKNFDICAANFLKGVESFGNLMDQFTKEINDNKVSDKKNMDSVWKKSKKQTPIWSNNDSDNLDKIWGKKND